MSKVGHNLSHGWRKKKVKTWYLLVSLPIIVLISAFFLRQNNLKMVELRNDVVRADKSGKNLKQAIEDLNEHIFKHMNTTTIRPVELVSTYNREAQKVIEQANKIQGKDVYKNAAAACEKQGIPLTSIAQCAADYALKNGKIVGPQKITLPDKSLFIYTFSSPLWTPDLAGFSILLTGVVFVWLIIRLIEFAVIRMLVRHRLKKGF